MIKVGVTGSFGSGKTTVAGMFRKRGARIIDADKIVHDLLKSDAVTLRAIRKTFGSEVVTKRGANRQKLAAIVFEDAKALKKLMQILHPRAKLLAKEKIKGLKGRMAVIDAPLLIEAGWDTLVDKIIVVKAGIGIQIKRLGKRTGLEKEDIVKRIRQQMPLIKKLKYADFVVDNHGPLADTDKQVEKIYRNLSHA